MATYTKPASVPRWNDNLTNNVEPPEAKKDEGWLFQELPPSTWENWKEQLNGQWWKWVDERWADGTTDDDIRFTPPAVGGALEVADGEFRINLAGGTQPTIEFDPGDSLEYDRSNNQLLVEIGSLTRAQFRVQGLALRGGLNVGFLSAPTDDDIRVGDSNFGLDFGLGSAPLLRFDGSQGYIEYQRASDLMVFYAGSVNRLSINNTGVAAPTGLQVGLNDGAVQNDAVRVGDTNFGLTWGTTPQVLFDTNDFLQYQRASNLFQFFINGAEEARIFSDGLSVTNGAYIGSLGTPFDNDLVVEGGIAVGINSNPGNDQILIGDTNFFLQLATDGIINFDSGSDRMLFDRSANDFLFQIAGTTEFKIGTPGVNIANGLHVGNTTTDPTDNDIRADGDVYSAIGGFRRDDNDRYQINASTHQWFINGVERLELTTSSLRPGGNQISDLGSTTDRWRETYTENLVVYGTNRNPTSTVERQTLALPNLITACGYFDGDTGALTAARSYNIASVVRGGEGFYTITFDQSLVNEDFVVVGCSKVNGGNGHTWNPNDPSSGAGFSVNVRDPEITTPANSDADSYFIVVGGLS